ncbi:CHAP domain-containing protein [Breznakia pachnodae]|uniref:Surface antigen n=1 Tax=Breznakia pachnodae TaxID=265178 RepID=A0ABU0DZC3_9FIRM|nr:CHAP domain-containing protein [Breznakia pachnodae]MDQ0359986.1 surface antigen [Breznakia pachnodae]
MKKVIILLLGAPLLFLLLIAGLDDGNSGSEGYGTGSGCEYSETETFKDAAVEEQRETVKNNLTDERYINAVLGIYSLDKELDVKEISKTFNELHEYTSINNITFSVSAYIQAYRYGEDYLKYLNENKLVANVENNKKYQEEHYKEVTDKNENDYNYYIEVLNTLNTHCVVTSIDLETEHYQSANPYVKINLRGQCTWYVWGRVREKIGEELPANMGNANEWYSYAQKNNLYKTGTTPKANSIIVLGGGDYGHVAVIESIEDGKVRITQGNYDNPCNKKGAICDMSEYARNYYAELFSDSEIDISILNSGVYEKMTILGYIYF